MEDKYKILVIDDEAAICGSLQTFFRFEDYEIETADGFTKAMNMARESDFLIYLLDLSMPDGDGQELIREIKKIRPTAQIIIMSGFATQGKVLDCFREGAVDCIMKPFKDLASVRERVDEACARLSRLRRLFQNLPAG
ncbi:MAG: response regulator [Nitrospinae bacterium]|nr:response regulator [Nitrospinota bacterium]